ncbi:hypothetical protein MMC22_009640 [Lobaria immixta]|nr:hypothetical protein [Lobaria immixta]
MAEDSLPWDQRPGYLAAIATKVAPGGLTAYRVPRPVGSSPADVTGFMPGQAEWAVDNYSDVLYQLYPTKEWYDFKKSDRPLQKIDEDGNPMVEPFPHPSSAPRPLLDFPILPDTIGTAESAPYFETVRRWDPRIRWEDLTMRMPLSGRPPKNTLQMRVSRFLRGNHSLIAWHDTIPRDKPNAVRDRVLRGLTDAQKAANTTRGSTPGLIDPSLGVAGGVVPYPVLRPGQGKSRKLRKDWVNAGESTQAGDKAAEFTAPVNKPAHSHGSPNKDALYGSQARQGTGMGRHHVTSPLKRKRENVDESPNHTCNEDGRRSKRTRPGSASAGEEAKAESERYGIPLDPALFTNTVVAPAPLQYGSALSAGNAGKIFYPTGGYQVSDKYLTGRFPTAKQPQSAVVATPESSQSAGGAMTGCLLTAPVAAMATSRGDGSSLVDHLAQQRDGPDEQGDNLDWDDWLDPVAMGNDEVIPGG